MTARERLHRPHPTTHLGLRLVARLLCPAKDVAVPAAGTAPGTEIRGGATAWQGDAKEGGGDSRGQQAREGGSWQYCGVQESLYCHVPAAQRDVVQYEGGTGPKGGGTQGAGVVVVLGGG